jgi:hypothetical protein
MGDGTSDQRRPAVGQRTVMVDCEIRSRLGDAMT